MGYELRGASIKNQAAASDSDGVHQLERGVGKKAADHVSGSMLLK